MNTTLSKGSATCEPPGIAKSQHRWVIPVSAFYAIDSGVDWINRGIRGI